MGYTRESKLVSDEDANHRALKTAEGIIELDVAGDFDGMNLLIRYAFLLGRGNDKFFAVFSEKIVELKASQRVTSRLEIHIEETLEGAAGIYKNRLPDRFETQLKELTARLRHTGA